MSNYKDRGIMKWAPFDALEGHGQMLEELIYNMMKKEKSTLSEDSYKQIEEELNKAISKDKNVSIDYYKDGYVLKTYGKIKKLDQINKLIVLSTEETIQFDDVLDLEAK